MFGAISSLFLMVLCVSFHCEFNGNILKKLLRRKISTSRFDFIDYFPITMTYYNSQKYHLEHKSSNEILKRARPLTILLPLKIISQHRIESLILRTVIKKHTFNVCASMEKSNNLMIEFPNINDNKNQTNIIDSLYLKIFFLVAWNYDRKFFCTFNSKDKCWFRRWDYNEYRILRDSNVEKNFLNQKDTKKKRKQR